MPTAPLPQFPIGRELPRTLRDTYAEALKTTCRRAWTLLVRRSFLALSLVSGCITTETLRSGQLVKLAGYDAAAEGQPGVVLETVTGKKLEYSRGKVLEFQMRNGTPMKGELQRLDFDARHGVLHLALVGGQNAYLDSSSPTEARLSSFSAWKTVLLVACIITGAVTATLGVAGIMLIGGRGFGGW